MHGERAPHRSISHPEMSWSALFSAAPQTTEPQKLRRAFLFFFSPTVARTWLKMPSEVIVVCVTDAAAVPSCFGFASCLCFPAEGGPCSRSALRGAAPSGACVAKPSLACRGCFRPPCVESSVGVHAPRRKPVVLSPDRTRSRGLRGRGRTS